MVKLYLGFKKNLIENAEALAKYSWEIIMNKIEYDCVLRALSHDETVVPNNSRKGIDIMGKWLSNIRGVKYRPDLLKKTKIIDTMQGRHYEDKINVLKEVYYCEKSEYKRYLVIDDITTTGATFEVIEDKIWRSNRKAVITFLAVGQTAKNMYTKQIVDKDLFYKIRGYNGNRPRVGEILD